LCVGIDKYGPPYDLAGCVNDASNWAKMLRSLKFDVTMLQDQEATRSGIIAAFASLTSSAQPGDVIVFQYAGHGTQVDDLDHDEADSLDEAFCPVDFASGRLLIDDDIRAVVAGVKPGVNLTCFIDCCHSGTITRALVPGARPASIPPGSKARFIPYSKKISEAHREFRESADASVQAPAASRGAAPSGLKEVCFSACQPNEVAYETAGAGQFTTRAMTVLAAGGKLTNADFMQQVVAAFGANPPQHPYLDCAEEAKARLLLRSLGTAAPAF
jgi:Caspase domain